MKSAQTLSFHPVIAAQLRLQTPNALMQMTPAALCAIARKSRAPKRQRAQKKWLISRSQYRVDLEMKPGQRALETEL